MKLLVARYLVVLKRFCVEQDAQDLVEYSLLLAFIVLVSAAAFLGVGPTTSGLWSIVNSRLAAANQSVNSGS